MLQGQLFIEDNNEQGISNVELRIERQLTRSLSENYNRNEKVRNREQIFGNLMRITAKRCQALFKENSRKFGPIFSILQ